MNKLIENEMRMSTISEDNSNLLDMYLQRDISRQSNEYEDLVIAQQNRAILPKNMSANTKSKP